MLNTDTQSKLLYRSSYKAFLLYMICFTFLIQQTFQYALEGNWQLSDNSEDNKKIILHSTERMYQNDLKNYDIQNILTFKVKGCQGADKSISYIANIQDNLIWLYQSQEQEQKEADTTLSKNQQCQVQNPVEYINSKINQETIKKIFSFTIKKDELIMQNPIKTQEVLKFKRMKQQLISNISGFWLLDKLYWLRADFSGVTLNPQTQKATFCNGLIQADIQFDTKDRIKFTNISQNDKQHEECEDKQTLISALSQIKYYRMKKQVELELFDEGAIEIIELAYNGELTE